MAPYRAEIAWQEEDPHTIDLADSLALQRVDREVRIRAEWGYRWK